MKIPLNQVGRVLADFVAERTPAGVLITIQGQTVRVSFTVEERDALRIAEALAQTARETPPKG